MYVGYEYCTRVFSDSTGETNGFIKHNICLLNFCWSKVHFVEPLIAPVLDFVCPSSRVSSLEWISCLHYFLLVYVVILTSRGVHCFSV